MTDILCNWLNTELSISKRVDQQSFARDFSSGYLVGEVLNKYQLQDDFDQFSQNTQSDAKLNNFTRVEPSLHLLAIPFDTNVARDIMTERHGVATRLMYQLYIALNNKKKANLTGVAMETMRPAAPAKLNAYESLMYKEKLKQKTPRQTDLNLEALVARFHEKQITMEKIEFEKRFIEQERIQIDQQNQRQALLERSRILKSKQSEMVAKIQSASVHIPKPPASKTARAAQIRKENGKNKEAKQTMESIADFEEKMKLILPPSKQDDDLSESVDLQYLTTNEDDKAVQDVINLIIPTSNDEYICKIRTRLQEDASAREEREKRRRKVLVDQMTAHENQEEARREEILVNRLMRQSQQERRIAVQLLQTRHEKEVITRNRIYREKQYEERRRKDFEDALNKEAEMARLAKEEYEEQIKKDKELHDQIAAERAASKYQKHYDMCSEVVDQMVDFSCKVAEYRELTNNLLPGKLMREWTALFIAGQPLFDKPAESTEPTPEQILEEEKQLLLDEGDFMEYKNMVGEWQAPDIIEAAAPPRDNPIVGHIVQRLFNIVHPPSPPPPPPEFPPFPIKACILGKVFSGKTSCINKLAEEHRLQVLCVDVLVDQAIEAHKAGEIIEITEDEEEEHKEDVVAEETPRTVEATPNEATPAAVDSESSPLQPTPLSNENVEVKGGRASQPPSNAASRLDSSASMVKKSSCSVNNDKPQPTARAKLGSKVFRFLKKGKPVDEQLIVDILVEGIRRVPENTGWIIDGFPQNYNQAKLLEKALSGFEDKTKKEPEKSSGKQKKSALVPDPRPAPPPPEPASGIDVVIVFDIDDEVCITRAAGRTCSIQTGEQYHQELNPPPEGSATGVGKQEQVIPVQDMAHDMEQIQHRITGFVDSWPKLEKWFTRFGTLKILNAESDERTVMLEAEKILEDTLKRLQGGDEEIKPEEPPEEKPEEIPEPTPPEPVLETPKEPEPEKPKSRPGSRGSRSGSGGKKSPSRTSSKDKREKSASPKRSASSKSKKSDTAVSKKGSRTSSPKSPSGKRSRSGKKGKTPEPEPEPEPEIPTGPPPPLPGSEEWDFVDQDIEMDLAQILAEHWETVEKSYVNNDKRVFRNIRDERENIYRYFYQMRKDYLEYLRRPDHKQEFVTQWQKDYNEVSDDMREDEETKSELHQRVDDLRERLWSICDERKEQAEKEREAIINDGWLDDRLGVLSNQYITLMQTEVDRFQDTVRLLKDYYRGMDGQIPDELNQNYARIPLVELPLDRPESPDKVSETASTPPVTEEQQTGALKSERSKSPRAKSPRESRSKSPKDGTKSPKESRSKSRTPSAKKRDKSKEKEKVAEYQPPNFDNDGPRKRIPLIPRRPVSPDPDAKPGAGGKGKPDKKAGKKDDVPGSESPAPPIDFDEKLIADSASTAVSFMSQIMSSELAAKEAEEEAERQAEAEIEKEKERERARAAATKKPNKKGKSRSPSPSKKGKKDSEPAATPPPVTEELSEEDQKKKETKEKMRQEYYFAIAEEENAAKVRVELIKCITLLVLQDLKVKAENVYKDMNDWLGARFLKEMESIDQLSETMRFGIENKEKIEKELLLDQEDFMLNEDFTIFKMVEKDTEDKRDLRVLKSSSSVYEVHEKENMAELFTVDQLLNLLKQFLEIAPNGVLSNKGFVETLENMISVSFGMETLPDQWMNISTSQIQEIGNNLANDTEYVDYRRFLLALTEPIPTPTQAELLETLIRFEDMDQKLTGGVTREQYDRTELWFPFDDSIEETGYDRLKNLKGALFDIFGNLLSTPSRLDYISMLMYFSAVPNSHEGFLRALSVASGCHMPRLAKTTATSTASTNLDQSADEGGLLPEGLDVEKDEKHVEPPMTGEVIPEYAIDAKVPLDALYKVLHHGESTQGDSHRYTVGTDPEENTSKEKLASVYVELGSEDLEPVLYKVLIEHPLIQDIVTACKSFKALDLKTLLASTVSDNIDATSTKTFE